MSGSGDISLTLPKISIILATHNTPGDRLQRVLEAIRTNTDLPYELIIVDTSTSPNEVSSAAARFNAKFLRPDADLGLGANWNIGAEDAAAPVLAFMCDDVYVDQNWASVGIEYLRGNVKTITGKLLFDGRDRVLNAAGSYTDVFGVSWNRGIGELDDGRYDKPEPMFRAVGAVFLVEMKAFKEVGGFDASYFLYAEDMDLCWRLRLAGYDCTYVPSMRARHKWMATTSKHSSPLRQYHYLLERNRLQTLLKNYSKRTLLSIIPWYLIIKIAHLTWLISHGHIVEARGVLRAFLWIASNLREILKKRRVTQKLRRRKDREVQQLMLKLPAELLLGLGFFKHPLIEAARRRD